MAVEKVEASLMDRESQAINRLLDWLRIPSISTDPEYKAEVRAAAEWCAAQLREAGLTTDLHETGSPDQPGHPVVWAHTDGPAGYAGPHVLFYGHYDVQPPDPLDLWESPPFEPVIKPADPGAQGEVPGERIVARGAVDDKGQVSMFLEALRAWHDETGSIPIKLSVLIEGEEESGSANLEKYLQDNKAALEKADICVISDTGMLSRTTPAITYGVRGLEYTEITLHSADQDLHSGLWGGRVPNPINELAKTLAKLWDDNGRVTIPGFYDDVLDIAPEEQQSWKQFEQGQVAALKKIGLDDSANRGESGFNAVEREWARPTCDVNGIWGGYTGAGAKTVIPAHATAKVSFRLVANQDPAKIAVLFKKWLDDNTPQGCRFEFTDFHGGWPGTVSTESPYLAAASRALASAAGTEPALIKSGGSIPVVGMLKKSLGLDTLLVGFGLDDDRMHSPNEKFELSCWRMGLRSHVRMIDEFAKMTV